MDPYKFRPSDGWALVLDDLRRETTVGGIFLPGAETGVEKVTEGSGELIAVGQGKKATALGLEKGLRILYRGFLKYAHHFETDLFWPNGEAKRFFLMKVDDIMSVIPPGLDVGVFSGRPQVPDGTRT